MKKETKELIILSSVIYCTVFTFHMFLVNWAMGNFDYCVTHMCGITHDYGIQDILWTLIILMPWIAISYLGAIWFCYLKDGYYYFRHKMVIKKP